MSQVHRHVCGYDFSDSLRAIAGHELWCAINRWTKIAAGDPEYFGASENGH